MKRAGVDVSGMAVKQVGVGCRARGLEPRRAFVNGWKHVDVQRLTPHRCPRRPRAPPRAPASCPTAASARCAPALRAARAWSQRSCRRATFRARSGPSCPPVSNAGPTGRRTGLRHRRRWRLCSCSVAPLAPVHACQPLLQPRPCCWPAHPPAARRLPVHSGPAGAGGGAGAGRGRGGGPRPGQLRGGAHLSRGRLEGRMGAQVGEVNGVHHLRTPFLRFLFLFRQPAPASWPPSLPALVPPPLPASPQTITGLLDAGQIDITFCNEDEAVELAGGPDRNPEAGLDYLAARCNRLAVVTLGEKVRRGGLLVGRQGSAGGEWRACCGCGAVGDSRPSFARCAGLHDQGAGRRGAHRSAGMLGGQGGLAGWWRGGGQAGRVPPAGPGPAGLGAECPTLGSRLI